MEPAGVIRMYASTPPPMEDGGGEDEDDEFGDFSSSGGGVPNSISFSELDTPAATFSQQSQSQSQPHTQPLVATSPPELLSNGHPRVPSSSSSASKANGVVTGPGAGADGTAPARTLSTASEEMQGRPTEHSQTTTANNNAATSCTDSKLRKRTEATVLECSSVDCNGGGPEKEEEEEAGGSGPLTNGFAAFDQPGTHAPVKSRGAPDSEVALESSGVGRGENDSEDDFADFAAFSVNTNSHDDHLNDGNGGQQSNWGNPFVADWQTTIPQPEDIPNADGKRASLSGASEEDASARDSWGGRDVDSLPAASSEALRNGDGDGDGGGDSSWTHMDHDDNTQTEADMNNTYSALSQTQATLNGELGTGSEEDDDDDGEGVKPPHSLTSSSMRCPDRDSDPDKSRDGVGVGAGSGNDSEPETETETETSLGRPLSTDALEDFGDFSTTGSVPSPPLLQEDTGADADATPLADHSHMEVGDGDEDEDDEEFGDFGDFSSTTATTATTTTAVGGFGASGPDFSANFDAYPSRSNMAADGAATTSDAIQNEFREDSKTDTKEISCATSFSDFTTTLTSRDLTDSECKTAAATEDGGGGGGGGGGGEEGQSELSSSMAVSDSFADFHSAPVEGDASGGNDDWTAFGEEEEEGAEEKEEEQAGGGEEGFRDGDTGAVGGGGGGDGGGDGGGGGEEESWASFGPTTASASAALSEESSEGGWHEGHQLQQQQHQTPTLPPSCSTTTDHSRTDPATAALLGRVQRLFQASFPEAAATASSVEDQEVEHLQHFLKPPAETQSQAEGDHQGAADTNRGVRDVWRQLQDIHNAFGLQHQWGGSHSNKMLLCSLGIDTRNILFTGQKKQPVIVPMYAASLGMLEPTKEPVKPISAAEMIASIAQMPAVAPDVTSTSTDTAQEVLPPVQFDWSSSGLTNPLDASGGSSLLNLDFFGPVEELVPSSGASIPGVDPELYELTTAKLEQSAPGSRVADAFARLMSTMEKTSTSTRKPRKEEHLSEEALKVMGGLPDLSFMQAKVLMFPTSLTPLASSCASSSATATIAD